MKLKKNQFTKVVSETYKDEIIVPLGFVTVDVEYENQKFKLNLHIIKENLGKIFSHGYLVWIRIP